MKLKPKPYDKDNSRYVVVLWKKIKKAALHSCFNSYCNGKEYKDKEQVMAYRCILNTNRECDGCQECQQEEDRDRFDKAQEEDDE